MSGIAKAGTSRIPTFGSRFPQQRSKSSSDGHLSTHHLGKVVRFFDKEGILRFVGDVHFSSGIWCGIELNDPVGKNDGSVRGVRYFLCGENRGLMAPLAKVRLADAGSCESLLNDDPTSGPYSMLFIRRPLDRVGSCSQESLDLNQETFYTLDCDSNRNQNERVASSNVLSQTYENNTPTDKKERNDTFSLKKIESSSFLSDSEIKTSETYIQDDTSLERTLTASSENLLDETLKDSKKRCKYLVGSTELLSQEENNKENNLVENSSVEAKRRRTANFTEEKYTPKKLVFSTPSHLEKTDNFLSKLRLSSIGSGDNFREEEGSKRSSLEYDESLGILTPDQMRSEDQIAAAFPNTRSPSLEQPEDEIFNKNSRKADVPSLKEEKQWEEPMQNMSSKFKDNFSKAGDKSTADSTADQSLGIIDEKYLCSVSPYTDSSSLKILLLNKPEDIFTRIEQTPSPEELPFDPTPIVEINEHKIETSAKSKTNNSFITSVTSITSLDTGYQGDGEMSRPGSRGAENSPLTRRPVPRPQTRKPDPMTDSDFYTESDVDIQEENPLRGDRKAQVIDGTLYGVDPQAAADIYANNRENMDSSGIFTDLENNPKTEEDSSTVDIPPPSPSEASTKTISENSQKNLRDMLERKNDRKSPEKPPQKDNPKKRNAPSPGISSPASFSSPRHGAKEDLSGKKYKIPKREVSSKVKSKLDVNPQQQRDKNVKKPVNKWDAVMNKISKTEQSKTNFKNVKSKVFSDIQASKLPNLVIPTKQSDDKKSSRTAAVQKTSSNKTSAYRGGPTPGPSLPPKPSLQPRTQTKRPASAQSPSPTEKRRFRRPASTRQHSYEESDPVQTSSSSSSGSRKAGNPQLVLTAESQRAKQPLTRNSKSTNTVSPDVRDNDSNTLLTLSELSQLEANLQDSQGEAKQLREEIENLEVRLLEVLEENKTEKTRNASLEEEISLRNVDTEEKGTNTDVVEKQHREVMTLIPQSEVHLKHATEEIDRLHVEIEELEDRLEDAQREKLSEKEQNMRFKKELKQFRNDIEILGSSQNNLEQILEKERREHKREIDNLYDTFISYFAGGNGERAMFALRCEFEAWRKKEESAKKNGDLERHGHKESEFFQTKAQGEVMKEPLPQAVVNFQYANSELRDRLRIFAESIHRKQMEINSLKEELDTLREESDKKESINKKFSQKFAKLEAEFKRREKDMNREHDYLKEQYEKLHQANPDFSEKESLNLIIDMKREEIEGLKKSLAEESEEVTKLKVYETKAKVLVNRVEQLEHQLELKTEHEQNLILEKKKLEEILREEINQKRRTLQFNEELQWKLKQNKEVINKILGYSEDTSFNRSILNSSFNERHGISRQSLERSLSFREKNSTCTPIMEDKQNSRKSKNMMDFDLDEWTGPTSPKVKSVVEKSESLSYVLDLDDSPDVVASRIIRRSFRQHTPPKNKSPSTKRPYARNPLSQSASSSAILTSSDKSDSGSSNIENLYDDVKDIEEAILPKLPVDSEDAQRLPSPEGIAEEDKLDIDDEDKLDVDEEDTSNTEDN